VFVNKNSCTVIDYKSWEKVEYCKPNFNHVSLSINATDTTSMQLGLIFLFTIAALLFSIINNPGESSLLTKRDFQLAVLMVELTKRLAIHREESETENDEENN
jgi:hypothetical protein